MLALGASKSDIDIKGRTDKLFLGAAWKECWTALAAKCGDTFKGGKLVARNDLGDSDEWPSGFLSAIVRRFLPPHLIFLLKNN